MSAKREQEYFDALRLIAKSFHPSEWFTDENAEKAYGVSGHEALEMAYDNMQQTAAEAIRGQVRPKVRI